MVREKLERIIEETGYIPHPQARSLAGGKTGSIGVIVFGLHSNILTHHIFYEVLQGIQLSSGAEDYDLLLFANRSGSDHEYWKRVATRRKVDGLVIMGEQIREPYLQFYREQNIPFVLVGKRDFPDIVLQCVTSDYYMGAYNATQHLLQQGRKNIVYIDGIGGIFPEQERFRGFLAALLEAGIDFKQAYKIVGEASQQTAREQMIKWLQREDPIDAVFAANDLMAFGAIAALKTRDYEIPSEVAVVGYDDVQAAAMFHPPLTTVRQDKLRLGQEAFMLLKKLMEGELSIVEPVEIKLSNELVIREST